MPASDDSQSAKSIRADLTETVTNFFASKTKDWGPESAEVYGQARLIAARLQNGTDRVVFGKVETEIERRKREDNNWTFANLLTAALSLVGALGLSHSRLDYVKAFLDMPMPNLANSKNKRSVTKADTTIFVVHGHDVGVRYEVVEVLQKITGKRPVVLREQADLGRSIIEKFEDYAANAGFAVVLLTADDVGTSKGEKKAKPRPRQNVVFEHGFFIGRLGRDRVVALYKSGIELPSDLSGVLYKPLEGNWQMDLAKELRAAGIEVDLGRLV